MNVDTAGFRGFDFHCHVDLHPDPPTLIAEREKNRIFTVAVTTTPRAWPQNRKWTAASACVHPAVGLHPELAGERYREIDLLEEYIGESRLIGEIGLDGSPQHRKTWDMQQEVFVRSLRCAQQLGGRVASVHSRRAADLAVKLIGEHTTPDRVLTILHWFVGSPSAVTKAISLGCYFSVNHRMLEHEAGLALVRGLPLDRLLTETDSPFSSRGDLSETPASARLSATNLAIARRMDYGVLHDALSRNAANVMRYAGLSSAR